MHAISDTIEAFVAEIHDEMWIPPADCFQPRIVNLFRLNDEGEEERTEVATACFYVFDRLDYTFDDFDQVSGDLSALAEVVLDRDFSDMSAVVQRAVQMPVPPWIILDRVESKEPHKAYGRRAAAVALASVPGAGFAVAQIPEIGKEYRDEAAKMLFGLQFEYLDSNRGMFVADLALQKPWKVIDRLLERPNEG